MVSFRAPRLALIQTSQNRRPSMEVVQDCALQPPRVWRSDRLWTRMAAASYVPTAEHVAAACAAAWTPMLALQTETPALKELSLGPPSFISPPAGNVSSLNRYTTANAP